MSKGAEGCALVLDHGGSFVFLARNRACNLFSQICCSASLPMRASLCHCGQVWGLPPHLCLHQCLWLPPLLKCPLTGETEAFSCKEITETKNC